MRTLSIIIAAMFLLPQIPLEAQQLHFRDKDLPCVNKKFNMNVHVVLNSEGNANYTIDEFQQALDVANQYFAPICMSFALCEYDTIINYNFDAIPPRPEVRTLFGDARRLNVYIVSSLGGTCGYGGQDIFMAKGCGLFTLTHELGHVFGLLHTFEGNGSENVNGSNCETEGDGICDTPADPYNPALTHIIQYSRGCEFVYDSLDANGDYYQPDMGNIMSYYGCECGFTRGQYLKMVETFENGKNQLW